MVLGVLSNVNDLAPVARDFSLAVKQRVVDYFFSPDPGNTSIPNDSGNTSTPNDQKNTSCDDLAVDEARIASEIVRVDAELGRGCNPACDIPVPPRPDCPRVCTHMRKSRKFKFPRIEVKKKCNAWEIDKSCVAEYEALVRKAETDRDRCNSESVNCEKIKEGHRNRRDELVRERANLGDQMRACGRILGHD